MDIEPTGLQQRISAGKPLLLAEISPPQGGDPASVREVARRLAGKVHALGVSDNRDRVAMSALAAAALVAAEGVEPILHVVTRDRNRIALVSEALGGAGPGHPQPALHQRHASDAGPLPRRQERVRRRSRPVAANATAAWRPTPPWSGEEARSPGPAPSAWRRGLAVCRSAGVASVAAGQEGQRRRRVPHHAAGVRPGTLRRLVGGSQPPRASTRRWPSWPASSRWATPKRPRKLAAKRPRPRIPEAVLERLAAGDAARPSGPPASRSPWRRSSGFRAVKGLRGFEICLDGDVDAALEVIEKSLDDNCIEECMQAVRR